MNIIKRNRLRSRLIERCARLTRYTHPLRHVDGAWPTHDQEVARYRWHLTSYSSYGVPALRDEVGRLLSLIHKDSGYHDSHLHEISVAAYHGASLGGVSARHLEM